MNDQDFIASYAGFTSFFNAPIIKLDQIKEGMAVIAGVPMDLGIVFARMGARLGPRGIREVSLQSRAQAQGFPEQIMVDIDTKVALRIKREPLIGDIGDFTIYPTDLAKTTESIKQGVLQIVQRGGFPVVLGGGHYVPYPCFEGFALGIAERKSKPRLGYLHIDSHTDFWDELGTGGRYNHATAVRRISENQTISYKNMAWVGLNGTTLDADQYRLLRNHKLKMLSSKDIRERGIAEVLKEAIEAVASDVDAVYVSIDIDVVDGSHSPGTTAVVFGGITALEFMEMMEILREYPIIKAVDLCEVSPLYDSSGRTVRLAASGLITLLRSQLFDVVDLD